MKQAIMLEKTVRETENEPEVVIRIPLTTQMPQDPADVQLTAEDLEQLPAAIDCARELLEFLKRTMHCMTSIAGGVLCIRVELDDDARDDLITASNLRDAYVDIPRQLDHALAQARQNAAEPNPLPSQRAISAPSTLAPIRAIGLVEQQRRPSFDVKGEQPIRLSGLPPEEYVSPHRRAPAEQCGAWPIVGLIRHARDCGHQVRLAGGSTVQLPADFTWARIHDVLDQRAELSGLIKRNNRSGTWEAAADVEIIRHQAFPLFDE